MVTGVLTFGFLFYTWLHYSWEWPGILKTTVCFILLAGCVVHYFTIGRLALERLLVRKEHTEVGITQIAVLLGHIVLLTALFIWLRHG